MIRLVNVERFYPVGISKSYVLRRINLEIREGEFLTIMGPSGSGKSTLLSILGMLDSSWGGEYYFYDHAIHKMEPRKRVEINKQYIGFVFQSYHLLDDLTVAENLDIPLSYRNFKKWYERTAVGSAVDTWTGFASWARRTCFPASCRAGSSSWWGSLAR